jgi:hypothetical protein
MTTKEDIQVWFNDGRARKDLTHMLVVCDTFDYEDYPVYVSRDKSVRDVFEEYNGKNMQKVMEVYSYRKNLQLQLNEKRAFHFD